MFIVALTISFFVESFAVFELLQTMINNSQFLYGVMV